jgi:hypothetical protein
LSFFHKPSFIHLFQDSDVYADDGPSDGLFSLSTLPTKHDKATNTEANFESALIPILPPGWFYGKPLEAELIRLFEVSHQDGMNKTREPFRIRKSLVVFADHTYVALVNGLPIKESCSLLDRFSLISTHELLIELFTVLHSSYTCIGNGESTFVSMCEKRKGKFMSVKRDVIAFVHEADAAKVVRHVSCELLVKEDNQRCSVCHTYRNRLRAMYSRFSKINPLSIKTNHRYLSTPQRTTCISNLKKKVRRMTTRNQRLTRLLNDVTSSNGITTDSQLEQDLATVLSSNMENMKLLPHHHFQRIFWEQQSAALKVKGKSGIRWHPLFIRWALNIMICSPKTYNVMRESGVLTLPSTRTLKDYTHWFQSGVGFQNEVFEQLQEDYRINEFNESQRQVVLIFDEMRIQESLVFDKSGGNIVGYVDVGDMNSHLKKFETKLEEDEARSVATHMLVLYVRGIMTKLEYPIAQFPTTGISGFELCDLVWTAVRRLLEIGLNVVVIVCDGAGANRSFFKMHKDEGIMKKGVVYKVKNRFDTNKYEKITDF